MIEMVHHITINAKNINASELFYSKFLGFQQLAPVEMEDHTLHYFELPGGLKLELITYVQDTKDCTAGLFERGRFRHLALQTDNIAYIAEHVHDYGGKILQPPRWVEQLQFTGMLVEDPNGCELEFIEMRKSCG